MGPHNNIDAVGPGSLSLILPTNLNGPPTIMFKWTPTKWAPNINIVPGGPGPFNLMFANQFKRITQVKLRVFILTSQAISENFAIVSNFN